MSSTIVQQEPINMNTSMPPMSAVQELVDLNASVVSLMVSARGRDDNIEETVRVTVRKLRSFLPSLRYEACNVSDAHDDNLMSPMEIDDDSLGQTIKMIPVESSKEGGQWGVEQNIFLLHDRVASISSHRMLGNQDLLPVECQFRLAVSIMYNVGLFLHKEGLRTGQSVHLIKAVQYYTLALEMLLSAVQLREEDLLLELAMLNNIGHAQTALASIKEAGDCLDYMRQLIIEQSDVLFSMATEENDAGCFLILLFVSESDNLALSPAA